MNKLVKRILIILLIIVGLFVSFIGFFAIKGAVMWNTAKNDLSIEQAAEKIRACDDHIALGELPEFYINAVISTEDRRFRKHTGISLKSIIRAAFYDLKEGSFDQGGSTITQQLAKNTWFSQEKKMERKFAEIFAAFDMERELSKNDILELYVNTIYFGSGYYGIEAAAQGYYGKSASELTEYECAMLAGLPNAPSAYSLDGDTELAEQRMRQVLQAMVDNDVISEEKMNLILSGNTE